MNGHLFGDPMTSTEITIPFSIASSWAYSSELTGQGKPKAKPYRTAHVLCRDLMWYVDIQLLRQR